MNNMKEAMNDRRTNILKGVEFVGVLLAIGASLYLSIAQDDTNLRLLFGIFLCSSLILTTTTYILKNYNFLLMSGVYLVININGFLSSF